LSRVRKAPRAIEHWLTRDYGAEGIGLNLTRARLGDFVYHLLRLDGAVTHTYAMSPQHDRSFVQFSISLPAGRRAALEEATGVSLHAAPKVRVA
jgi:hypothetical protein